MTDTQLEDLARQELARRENARRLELEQIAANAAEANKREQQKIDESCANCIFLEILNISQPWGSVDYNWNCLKYQVCLAEDSGIMPWCAKPCSKCTGKVLE